MTSTDPEDRIIRRNRRTFYLLVGGIASLLVPLLGVLYIRMSKTVPVASAGNSPHGFARRETQADRIKAAPAPAPPVIMTPAGPTATAGAGTAPAAGDSLGYIKGGSEYFPRELPQQTTAHTRAKSSPPVAKSKSAAAKARKKKAKPRVKTFVQPRLQAAGSSDSFYNFKGRQQLGKTAPAGQPPNPDQTALPQGQMPDVSGLLKSIPGASDPSQTGGVDVGNLLKGIPGGEQNKP